MYLAKSLKNVLLIPMIEFCFEFGIEARFLIARGLVTIVLEIHGIKKNSYFKYIRISFVNEKQRYR